MHVMIACNVHLPYTTLCFENSESHGCIPSYSLTRLMIGSRFTSDVLSPSTTIPMHILRASFGREPFVTVTVSSNSCLAVLLTQPAAGHQYADKSLLYALGGPCCPGARGAKPDC